MAGTRSAPLLHDGTADQDPPVKRISIKWIDLSGQTRSDSFFAPSTVTKAQLEALVVALQAASNASIYGIEITEVFLGDAETSNATNTPRSESTVDQMFFLTKNTNPEVAPKRVYVPAPLEVMFSAPQSNELNPSAQEIVDILTAWLAVLGANWNVVSGRFTQKTEINESVKI